MVSQGNRFVKSTKNVQYIHAPDTWWESNWMSTDYPEGRVRNICLCCAHTLRLDQFIYLTVRNTKKTWCQTNKNDQYNNAEIIGGNRTGCLQKRKRGFGLWSFVWRLTKYLIINPVKHNFMKQTVPRRLIWILVSIEYFIF